MTPSGTRRLIPDTLVWRLTLGLAALLALGLDPHLAFAQCPGGAGHTASPPSLPLPLRPFDAPRPDTLRAPSAAKPIVKHAMPVTPLSIGSMPVPQRATSSGCMTSVSTCPMPVMAPDPKVALPMPVEKPAAGSSEPMPVVPPNCTNPLANK